ncbi:MAG: hypothetical protein WC627_01220 [Legionella sp.]|jgi:hypothetical protein
MTIGIYWSEDPKVWIKFSMNGDQVQTQIARARADYPALTGNWETIQVLDTTWNVTQTHDKNQEEPMSFRLQGGILYSTEGKINPVSGVMNVNVLNANGQWGPLRHHNVNLFPNFNANIVATPSAQIPMNPETQAQIWANFQANDTRKLLINDNNCTFIKEYEVEMIYMELNDNLVGQGFAPALYTSATEYLTQLEDIVSNNQNPINKALSILASHTFIDEDLHLNDKHNDDNRRFLMDQKIGFYFNLLKDEASFLRASFNLPVRELKINNNATQLAAPPVDNQQFEFI